MAESWEITDEKLTDQWWRLNNLYYILDKAGRKILFQPNSAQEQLYHDMWYLNVILKARQRGFTTFIDTYILDCCVFNENVRAGIIAHHIDDAKVIFRDKIKFPYNCLPDALKEAVRSDTSRADEIMFSNNSSIRVSTSMRSGTAQLLHVSEYGKIAAKYPDKAREIKTGAFEAVGIGNMIWVESTAEGRSGEFYELCEESRKMAEQKDKKLNELEFKFHFFPWFDEKGYWLDPRDIVIPPRFLEYFDDLETKHGIKLNDGQKAWYMAKERTLGEDMKREYPSTPAEAFEASLEGAYFAKQMTAARKEGRICRVPFQPGIAVDTWWDIGFNDSTAIWFTQNIGREIHVIRFFENSGEGLEYYKGILDDFQADYGYHYGRHVWPHDGGNHEWGLGKKRSDYAAELGLRVDVVPRGSDKTLSIEAARRTIPICWFDEANCEGGIIHIDSYRKEWDAGRGCWKNSPLHDEHSNGADAFQTLGMAHGFNNVSQYDAKPRRTAGIRPIA